MSTHFCKFSKIIQINLKEGREFFCFTNKKEERENVKKKKQCSIHSFPHSSVFFFLNERKGGLGGGGGEWGT